MEIKIMDPDISFAIGLIINRSKGEMRILSPTPGKEPYWHHIVRTYYWLINVGIIDHDTLLASIYHDSVEDGQLTLDELRELVNDDVYEIVCLLTEDAHTDHRFMGTRDEYFERTLNYTDLNIRTKAMQIKIADRYDNLIGMSFRSDLDNFEKLKARYLNEIDCYLREFSDIAGMNDLLEEGVAILNGNKTPPDISIEVDYSEFKFN